MPTKAPEYMMSGTPIILFAPKNTAITKYCEKYKCARVVSKYDIGELSKAIKDLIHSESERKKIAQSAVRTAEEKHNSTIITKNFKNIIFELKNTTVSTSAF